jgi:hypothetical protein
MEMGRIPGSRRSNLPMIVRPIGLLVALLLGVSLVGVAPMSGSGQESSAPYRIAVYLDRSYAKNDSSLRILKELSRLLVPTKIQSTESKSVAQTIVDVYGFGRRQRPEAFDFLYQEILRLNQLDPNAKVDAGPLLVPTAPRWSPPRGYDRDRPKLGYDHSLESNRVVLSTTADIERSPTAGTPDSLKTRSVINEDWLLPQRDLMGATSVLLRANVEDISTFVASTAHLKEVGLFLRGPFNIAAADVAAATAGSDDEFYRLSPAERTAVEHAKSKRKVQIPLVVLDLEWPSDALAKKSTGWLYDLINEERREKGIGPPLAMSQASPLATTTIFPHSAAIADALYPLSDLDTVGVAIQYIPVIPAGEAKRVLTDLVSTYFISWSRNRAQTPASNVVLEAEAAATINSVQVPPANGPVTVVRTTRTILDALVYLLHKRAERSGVSFVISASWVLSDSLEAAPTVPEEMLGLIVAAAGNFDEDVMRAGRDLGRLSVNGRKVLTVENYSGANLRTCRSSFFPAGVEAVSRHRILGYRGGRANQNPFKCGTSFAAPRVAWFIASYLSTRNPTDSTNRYLFSENLWSAIFNASPTLAGNPGAYILDPVRLLPP